MTDEQIIKYWNEIDSETINEHGEEFDVYITMPVAKSTVDIINRQKAEIERLLQKLQQAKSEAVKGFAERLKKEALIDSGFEVLQVGTIDNLVKEITE